jgi:predicted aminopeptidase
MATTTTTSRRARGTAAWRSLVAGVVFASGCSPGYVLQQTGGQLSLLSARRPIDDVLADPETNPTTRDRLLLIREARAWGESEIGLKHTDSYETYVELNGKPVSWLVTACPPDSMKAESWWFPIVGRVPYLGFFDLEDARAEKADLEEQGFDVNVRSVPAYSTLGWFSDPVFSTFIQWPLHSAVNTIFHETTHATVWIKGSVSLNESLADVVGEEGAKRFLAARFGADSVELRAFQESEEEGARFHAFALELNAELRAAYALELPRAQKLELKAAILRRGRERFRSIRNTFKSRYYREFDRLEWNNALVASIAVYREESATWKRLFESKNGDLRAFLDAAKAIAGDDDPRAALERAAGPAAAR